MKFDQKTTAALQDWLNTPEPSRDIAAGASLLLALTRNRALYNSVLAKPAKYMPKMVYELRKHLRMRLDGVAAADLRRIEPQVMQSAAAVISTGDELPRAQLAHGRRADHDSLPPEIQRLWDDNESRYRQINVLFNELKAMHDCPPCDRYEKLTIMADLDRKYRANLARYDAYAPITAQPSAQAEAAAAVVADAAANAVANARKALSKNIKKYGQAPDDAQRETIAARIRASVAVIAGHGERLTAATIGKLAQIGITAG